MEVFFKNSFLRDCKKLPAGIREEVERVCFEIFPAIDGLHQFDDYPLRKMRGFNFYYRIKIKGFRLGFKKADGAVEFMRILPRKDIYKFFP